MSVYTRVKLFEMFSNACGTLLAKHIISPYQISTKCFVRNSQGLYLQQNPKECRQMLMKVLLWQTVLFVVANKKNQQKSNHPIVGDIGWLIWISEFTGQCWYWSDVQRHPKIYMISPQLSLIQCLHQQLIRSPHCIWMATILASLGNSLFPSFLPLLFLDHHHWDRNHDWKLPLLFFVLEFCQAGFGNLFGRPPTEVVLLVHPSNSCQVCKCLTGAWLFPTRRPWKGDPSTNICLKFGLTCHQPGKSSRRSISPLGKASNNIWYRSRKCSVVHTPPPEALWVAQLPHNT